MLAKYYNKFEIYAVSRYIWALRSLYDGIVCCTTHNLSFNRVQTELATSVAYGPKDSNAPPPVDARS